MLSGNHAQRRLLFLNLRIQLMSVINDILHLLSKFCYTGQFVLKHNFIRSIWM